MYHIYAFGKKSKQILILTPDQAKTMNDFTDCFIYSQEKHLERTGERWDPIVDPTITMFVPDDNPELMKKYDKVATLANRQHKIRNKIFDLFRIDVSNEDIHDYLVKKF
jgi:hypothetical protein